jgi:hypothetical protein
MIKGPRPFFKLLLLLCPFYITVMSVYAQDSYGAQILTKESYQYGRFEVRMQSAEGDGIVSSFFLYNVEAGKKCKWPAENNEIDVEMTGNDQNLYFTTHHPDPNQPWSIGEEFDLSFNPHRSFHRYAIEWEPGIVRWLVDGDVIYVQNDQATNNLKYPMAIMMNLWAAEYEDWVGVWDPSVMPRNAIYDYVSYAAYTPGTGNVGTGNNFTVSWTDDFNSLDNNRWEVSDFDQISPLTVFVKKNIEVSDGKLLLHLTEPSMSSEVIPVTFSVDVTDANLDRSDIVYLNGSFNSWCGNCNPMQKNGDVWSLILNLPPNKYEYLFTVNVWERIGEAPMASSCDFQPCDEFPNYGFYLPEGDNARVLPTFCWSTCDDCLMTSTGNPKANTGKTIIGTFDILGRPVTEALPGQLVIYLYSDGSAEKSVILE